MYNVQYTMYNVQCTMYTHFRAQHSFHSSHSNDDCIEETNATRWSLLSIVSTSTTVTLKTAPWLLQSKQRKEEQFRKSFGGGKLKWNCPGISTCPLGCEGTRSTSCGTTSSSGSLWQVGFQFQYCEILLGSASWSMDTISNWLSRRNRPHSGSHRTQLQDLHDDEKA